MKKRLLYGAAIVLLAISAVLVVWQGSFRFGDYEPADPGQTFIFWAISTLIFLLMVTLGFMLFRTGVKLWIERQSNREGSRIKTKLVLGALALTFMPSVFLVLFSVQILNLNLARWFSKPAEGERIKFVELAAALRKEVQDEANVQAALLASQSETKTLASTGVRSPGFLARFAAQQDLSSATVLARDGKTPLDSFGPFPAAVQGEGVALARAPVESGGVTIAYVQLASRIPLDLAEMRAAIERYNREYNQIVSQRKNVRQSYLLFITLITVFILFVATWIAQFLANKISGPIGALVQAAGEVRKGNLQYRVRVKAIDELAGLVRGFNEMTQELEANSRELDARRRFTEAILESIPTGVISIGSDGSIQRVNRALTRIFAPEAVARAARLEDLFSREDTAELKYLMKRARRTGLASRQMELRTPQGNLQLAATVSALEEKLTSGFVVVLEDTSELLRAQKALAWHEVARRIAHEIKNPLTPIALCAERIARQIDKVSLPPENRRILQECAGAISECVESVKTLVNEFSQFARFPAAQPVRCDLNEIVESALGVFQGRLDGIEIRTQLAPGLPAVNVDREQFKRVVINLVDNAAEAMQDSLVRQLYVATQPGAADSVELVLADTGCGISAEDREKLFLPYFSTKGRGTGLGLAIVNHILADHNAHIRVEDNVPAGARFTVEVPAVTETAEEKPEVHPTHA